MPRKRRRKLAGCCFIPCCGDTSQVEPQKFDDFEDTTLARGRILLQQYEETHRRHTTQPPAASANATDNKEVEVNVQKSSQSLDTSGKWARAVNKTKSLVNLQRSERSIQNINKQEPKDTDRSVSDSASDKIAQQDTLADVFTSILDDKTSSSSTENYWYGKDKIARCEDKEGVDKKVPKQEAIAGIFKPVLSEKTSSSEIASADVEANDNEAPQRETSADTFKSLLSEKRSSSFADADGYRKDALIRSEDVEAEDKKVSRETISDKSVLSGKTSPSSTNSDGYRKGQITWSEDVEAKDEEHPSKSSEEYVKQEPAKAVDLKDNDLQIASEKSSLTSSRPEEMGPFSTTMSSHPAPLPSQMNGIDRASHLHCQDTFGPKDADRQSSLHTGLPGDLPSSKKFPSPPPGPLNSSNFIRASKLCLPKEHFTFISKTEILPTPLFPECDDVIPVRREPSSDSSLKATYSGSSTESELYKLLELHKASEFNQTSDSSEEQIPDGASCNLDKMFTSEAEAETSRTRDSCLPRGLSEDTKISRPLGAAPVVLGPISSSKGTPEQTSSSRSLISRQRQTAPSLGISEIPVVRRLDFHTGTVTGPVSASLTPTASGSATAKVSFADQRSSSRRGDKPKDSSDSSSDSDGQNAGGRKYSKSYQLPTPFVPAPPAKNGSTFPSIVNTRKTNRRKPLILESSDSSDMDEQKKGIPMTLKSIAPPVSNAEAAYVPESNFRHSSQAMNVFPKAKDYPMTQPKERLPNVDHHHHLTQDTLQPPWASSSSKSSPYMNPSSQTSSRLVDIRERNYASTSRLPAPLPPPDLLAPTLFKRRSGQGLPPVMGRAPPAKPNSNFRR